MSAKQVMKKKGSRLWLLIVLAVAVLILSLFLIIRWHEHNEEQLSDTPSMIQTSVDNTRKLPVSLEYGLLIEDVSSYTGVYMEDGSDDPVSDVLMIAVKNTGTADIQYAEIEMPVGTQTAFFTLSTLPIGQTVVVLESNRMCYDAEAAYSTARALNVALFSQPLNLFEDRLALQSLDGALNVTNISDEDIVDDVVIYYKNTDADILCGGITYRVFITGGIQSGETKQVMAGHYTTTGSRVMFISCG